MKLDSQYLLGGIILLILISLAYVYYSIYATDFNPLFLPLPFVIISFLLIMTGIFERKKYYNKAIYLILVAVALVSMLILIYIQIISSDSNKILNYIGTLLYIFVIFKVAHSFINYITKLKTNSDNTKS